jgi:D-glycero-alpha-D-manno-heptose-7-phosphate kinase
MIICRTPTRISFFGGGTDYPIWYRENNGMVLSTTINKYSYITLRYLPRIFDYNFRVRYFNTEETLTLDEIKHPSVRECARILGIKDGFEMIHYADLPSGTGLGSSSTFTVGMLHSFYSLINYMPTKRELAVQALKVEQEVIGESVGSQDQVAAAFGGFNQIQFGGEKEFEVDPIILGKNRMRELQDKLLLCFTGFSRSASEIAQHQIRDTPARLKELNAMSDLTIEALSVMKNTASHLDDFGKLLNEQWKIKRSLTAQVSTPEVDEIYEVAIKNGALGGKLLGAGGGGFMLFYADPLKHDAIRNSLSDKQFISFRFEDTGSKIVYYSHE